MDFASSVIDQFSLPNANFVTFFIEVITKTDTYTLLKSIFFRSVFNYFLLSLAVSDLMSAVVSPLYLYRVTVGFSEWKLPAFLCPVITVPIL